MESSTIIYFIQFCTIFIFYTWLKTSDTQRFPNIFWGYKKVTLKRNSSKLNKPWIFDNKRFVLYNNYMLFLSFKAALLVIFFILMTITLMQLPSFIRYSYQFYPRLPFYISMYINRENWVEMGWKLKNSKKKNSQYFYASRQFCKIHLNQLLVPK